MRNTTARRTSAVGQISVLFLCLSACATSGSSVAIGSQASGSSYFSLSRPGAYKIGRGFKVAGRVCRRARTTLLSPPRVRIEHLAATGEVLGVAHADVPAIYRRADQACSPYAATVDWAIADREALRACFERGKSCPVAAELKAVITVPVAPALTP